MDACKWLRLKHQVYATELTLRDRTESFDDHFNVDRRVAIDNILLNASKCLFYICT
jgi:hypothetical protein